MATAIKELQRSLNSVFARPRRRGADAATMRVRSEGSAALAKARRLAEQHGVKVEKEAASAYWVTCAAFADSDNDPLDGDHFATDGTEVLSKVECYVEALAHLGGAK